MLNSSSNGGQYDTTLKNWKKKSQSVTWLVWTSKKMDPWMTYMIFVKTSFYIAHQSIFNH